MKRYYSEYVSHCLTFYSRYPRLIHFRSETDRKNWKSCEIVLSSLSDEDRELVIEIYKGSDSTIKERVASVSRNRKIGEETVWRLIGNVEHRVAVARGLV